MKTNSYNNKDPVQPVIILDERKQKPGIFPSDRPRIILNSVN